MVAKQVKSKKKTMQQQVTSGEQLDLIDVGPENLEKMRPVASRCKVAEKKRLKAVAEKKKGHREMVELVKEAKLLPNEKGNIEFVVDGLRVKVTPHDWSVSVVETS